MTVVLRLSEREKILWDLHTVLDSVAEGEQGREEFVQTILARFGVSRWKLRATTAKVCARLPVELDALDMSRVLAVLEEVLPITWHADMKILPTRLGTQCREALLKVLTERQPGTLPKAVSAHMISAIQGILGGDLDVEFTPALQEAITERLVCEMWRSTDTASREQLTDWLMFSVRSEGKLAFDGD